jgi:Bacterial PH domain
VSAVSARPSTRLATTWPARRSAGGDAAVLAACAALAVALGLLALAAVQQPGPTMLGIAVLAAAFGLAGAALLVWGLAYRRLIYTLTDTSLHVRWLGHTVILPYAAIDGIYTGQRLVGHAAPGVPRWPGIFVGPGRLRGVGRLRFFTTSPDPAALTLITLEHGGLVVSARNPHDFRTALIQRVQDLGEDAPVVGGWLDQPIPMWSALTERWLLASVSAGVLLVLVVLALVALGLPNAGDIIPLHFDATGQPSQLGPKGDLLRLPALGLLLLVVNAALGIILHARDAVLARVLWVGGAVLQAALVVAVVRLLAGA